MRIWYYNQALTKRGDQKAGFKSAHGPWKLNNEKEPEDFFGRFWGKNVPGSGTAREGREGIEERYARVSKRAEKKALR